MQNTHKIKVFSFVVVAIIALILAGKFVFPSKEDNSVIKIGGISALTGVGVGIGEEESKGAQLAVEEINARGGIKGHPLELISEDVSIDKIKNGVSVVRKLIEIDKVVAIVGPQWDEPAFPILPITEESKIPIIGPDSSPMLEAERDYKYFFSTWYDNKVGIRELLRFAQAKKLNRIAIIKPLSAGFWEYTADIMKTEASNYGIIIVDEVDIGNPMETDFRTHILKVREKNPDAIFVVTNDFNQCTFLKQAEQVGYNGVTLGTEASGDPVSITQCPELLEKRFFSMPVQSNNYKIFAEKFKAKFGDYPRFPSTATSYDAVMAIANGLEKGNLAGGEVLRENIANIRDFAGAGLESISFDDKGFIKTPENAFEMQTVKDGKFVKAEY